MTVEEDDDGSGAGPTGGFGGTGDGGNPSPGPGGGPTTGGNGGAPAGPGGMGGEPCTPLAETCNGLDEDCDGIADNGNPGGGASCSTGLLGPCGMGVMECDNGSLACAQTTFPSAEQCDSVDNDCNGAIDEVCGCPNLSLMSMAPQTVSGNNAASPAMFSGSCAGTGPEDSYSFTAPSGGLYTIDTIGSAIDTVLHVHDGSCGGAELACDDDGGGGLTSLLQVSLAPGQQVVIFADSYSTGGAYTLHISAPAMCPDFNLGSTSPQTVNGDNSLGLANETGSCAGSGPELSYSFTAPATGTFTFDTNGSPIDTVLHVRNGSCGGAELACDDDGGQGLNSQLSVSLTQGQVVVVFADSFSSGGQYVLNVSGP